MKQRVKSGRALCLRKNAEPCEWGREERTRFEEEGVSSLQEPWHFGSRVKYERLLTLFNCTELFLEVLIERSSSHLLWKMGLISGRGGAKVRGPF